MASFTPSGSGGIPLQTTQEGITSYSVINQLVPTQNTEVAVLIPSTSILFSVYNRTSGTTKIGFSVGDSGSVYITLPPGAIQEFRKLAGTSMSIYLQCPKPAQVIEILCGHS